MPELVWYRSLYWRIAIGSVVLLAGLLAAQGLVFFWLTGRVASAWPGRSASELATTIASDLSQQLASHPDVDINRYVNSRYQSAFRAFAVVMRDGHVAFSQRVLPPPGIDRAARTHLFGDAPPGPGRRPPDGGPGGPGFGRGRRGFGARDGMPPDAYGRGYGFRGGGDRNLNLDFATITIAGRDAGVVAVPVDPPPLTVAMRDLGPRLATVALSLLVVGSAIGALLVFRPTHRRLQSLEAAARAIGSGEVAARAPETGGDEVSALARAFNDMAAQLEQRTQALETADRARRQLVADVSHELTTPLAAIRGYIETLSMTELPIDTTARARYLHIVGEETDRLEHIVRDLLDVARLEGGGGSLAIHEVAVAQLFDRVRDRHERALEQKHITLDMAEAPGDLTLQADPNRLEQAIQNLVANAIRHTPDGGRVRLAAERDAEAVRFVVEDTGPGIPEEHLPHVFDRFYKVDVSRAGTALPSGSGLGLSIVRAIVERHGGTVTAANVPGAGARFEITLPQSART